MLPLTVRPAQLRLYEPPVTLATTVTLVPIGIAALRVAELDGLVRSPTVWQAL